jgi:hypothetical protein
VKLEAGSCIVNIAESRRDFEKHATAQVARSHVQAIHPAAATGLTDLTDLTCPASESIREKSSFPLGRKKEKFFLAFIKLLKFALNPSFIPFSYALFFIPKPN